MRDQVTRPSKIQGEIILSRVRIYCTEQVMADAAKMHRVSDPRLADHFDGLEIRHTIEAWGQTTLIKLRCPATWWQHLKLALRMRWPRLFRRLAVRFDEKIAENGAIVEGLAPLRGSHRIIPYHVPIFERSYTSDPTRDDS